MVTDPDLHLQHLQTDRGALCLLDAPHPSALQPMGGIEEASCRRCRRAFLRLARIQAVAAGVDARGTRLVLAPAHTAPLLTISTPPTVGVKLVVLGHGVEVRLVTPLATLPSGETLYQSLVVRVVSGPTLEVSRG